MGTYKDNEEFNFVFVYLKNRLREMEHLSEILEATSELNMLNTHTYQNVPASDSVVERTFSKLQNVITKNRNFSDINVKFFVVSYVNM